MNCLKNSRSILSRLLHQKPAVSPPPRPLPAQAPPPRYYYAYQVLRDNPAVRTPPLPQAPHPRYFYTSPRRQEVIHFSRRRGGSRWYHDQRKLTAAVLIAGGGAVAIYVGNLEIVPYTNRTHFIILSPTLERQLGESQFADLKKQLGPKILPPLHPDSVRVRLIASEIVRAVHRGVAGRQLRYASYGEDASYGYGDISADLTIKDRDAEAGAVMLGGSPRKNASAAEAAQRDDEVLDDRWVTESRNRGKARGAHPQTSHLDGLNWEVIVVRDNMVNAMCLPGGKIIVFTGLLDKFRADAEVATVLGHEVGFLNIRFRMEIEADHIGLLLLAAAGYDPRVAPSVYEKLGKVGGDSALNNYLSTHPSSKKRAQLLSQAHVMNEALELYREKLKHCPDFDQDTRQRSGRKTAAPFKPIALYPYNVAGVGEDAAVCDS
ncbi:hypothetical protein PR202_ga02655 [Eleusine coracana subsp. coracana]|uniref:Peptidase M48 domain-containing protein n=1 Tax=Eleusine coracana subsp. coracana TaxID=191504 RepID=A0AAV5BM64_ELECO|nr:hypothetical protein PR202_ga02655 [Eleusine coracana subsp. coracana]